MQIRNQVPKILAIDTSTEACSAALLCGNKIYNRFIIAARQHTKFILPMISEVLTEAQLELSELDAIAFGCGPGSFTGVRLAASVTQGIAFAKNLPVVKISSLRALAQEIFVESEKERVLIAQDARMQEIYLGEYQVDAAGIMQAVMPDRLLASNGYEICANMHPKARYIVQLAEADFAKNLIVTAEEALPIYLREEVTRLNK